MDYLLDHLFHLYSDKGVQNMCFLTLQALNRYSMLNCNNSALLTLSSSLISCNKTIKKRDEI